MRFVGWKDGKLIKGAPSLPQGWTQENFIEEASLPHWELVEPIPETKKAPSSTSEESVHEEIEEIKDEEAEEPEEVVEEIDSMNVTDLKIFIEQRGGTVDSKWLKSDLVMEARKYVEETVEDPEEES
jgi:hypothetical protein